MSIKEIQIIQEINRILRLPPVKGDRELAWAVLGFEATREIPQPQRPSMADFLIQVNCILHRVAPRNFRLRRFPDLTEIQRRRRMLNAKNCVKRILESIHIIGSFHQRYFGHSVPESMDLFRFTIRDRSQFAPRWDTIAHPMDLASFNAHRNIISTIFRRPDPPPVFDLPSLEEEKRAVNARQADRIHDPYMQPPNKIITLTEPAELRVRFFSGAGDGNCYWYAISAALGYRYTRFENVKSNILSYYMNVLRDPNHIRYRMYTVIEKMSRIRSKIYGETSLARCLHMNEYRGVWPVWTPRNHLGINQVVADYYHVELVELDDVRNYNRSSGTNVSLPLSYVPRARGDPAHRQIIIAKEENHFFSVKFVSPVPAICRIPTLHLDRVDNYFPWYRGKNLAEAMPLQLPAISGHTDPTIQVRQLDRMWPRAGLPMEGFLPNLPTDEDMEEWTLEVPPPNEGPDPQLGDSTDYAAFGVPPLAKVRAPRLNQDLTHWF